MRGVVYLLPAAALLASLSLGHTGAAMAQAGGDYVAIFNGTDLSGWHVSAKTGHSRKSKNQSGGRWVVADGAIVGSQDEPGNGGIIITDKKYKNFEIMLEMKNDYGPDSGLFLRSTEEGTAWQALIDYHAKGSLMGVYGEGKLGGRPNVKNHLFLDSPDKIIEVDAPIKLPVAPEDWPTFWKHGEWNTLKARIVGNPPRIDTWIRGVKFMEWTEKELRYPDDGGIALQVHGGGDYTRQFVRYRNVRVKELE
jgi:hypothetical protein